MVFAPFRAALDLKRTSSEIEVWFRRVVGRQVKGSTDEIMKNVFGNVFMLKAVSELHYVIISATDMTIMSLWVIGLLFQSFFSLRAFGHQPVCLQNSAPSPMSLSCKRQVWFVSLTWLLRSVMFPSQKPLGERRKRTLAIHKTF